MIRPLDLSSHNCARTKFLVEGSAEAWFLIVLSIGNGPNLPGPHIAHLFLNFSVIMDRRMRSVRQGLYEDSFDVLTVHLDPFCWVVQINDTVYELFRPPSKPAVQVLFFHGLERGHYGEAHLSTWESGDGSGSLWPQTWFVEDFPGAQVLSVSYLALPLLIQGGVVDLYIIAENLISDLISARVGQDGQCPVVLVGHSFGGLVMKQLCLHAWRRSSTSDSRRKSFLNNVKGLFFYSTPHHGFSSMEPVTLLLKNDNSLKAYVKCLNQETARSHIDFENLCRVYDWPIAGVGETLPTEFGGSRAFTVVPEASSRYGNWVFAAHADHFTVCKPTSKRSGSFSAMRNLVAQTKSSGGVSIHQVSGVPRYFAGSKERLQDIEEMLMKHAVVAVVGMSGIGKTAIAKLVFNQISKEFECTLFYENDKGIPIHSLEYYLPSLCFHQGTQVRMGELKWSHLQEKKTLIVMDGVVSEEQLLIVDRLSRFGTGSCLIITARDRAIVPSYGAVYDVPFLTRNEAMSLFCHHVFGQGSIPEDLIGRNRHLETYVSVVVDRCGGLPLAIEAVGSYLRDHDSETSFWEETIDKLRKAQSIMGSQVDYMWAPLRLSYDALSEAEQRMFIDAATYFYEQPLEEALAAWHSAYGSSHVIWKSLLNKSMVKEVRKNTTDISRGRETQYVAVWVHDQFRGLAKSISERSDVNWLRADASSLHLPSGDREIQMSLPSDLLNHSERLKYLDLDGVVIEGLLTTFPRKLSLLKWKMTSMSELPEIALEEMEDLAVLELTNWKISKRFSEALGNLINLHILHLDRLKGLDCLPSNFGNLRRLNRLELVNLGLLKLPDSFGNLRALEYLALVNINILVLPECFEQLSSLRELVLDSCTQLGSLEGLERLKSLITLTIRNCERLTALTESFGMLTALEYLYLVNINISALPESFGQLFSLRELMFLSCTQLARLPESLGQLRALQKLTIEDAGLLKALPDIFGMLLVLKHLSIRNCQKLQSLPESFGLLSVLEVLVLHGCSQLTNLPESLGKQRALQSLTIDGACKLEALPDSLGMLSSLKHLTLVGVSISTLPESVGELFSLQTLTMQDCEKLRDLPPSLKRLHISERLVIERCVQLERLPKAIEERSAVKDLTIVNASSTVFCDSLRMLPALQHLTLINVSIEAFPESFEDLSSLVTLTIRSCLALSSLPQSLGFLSSLEGLYIHNCPKLSSLPDSFVHLSSLKELYIYDCPVGRGAASEAVVQTYYDGALTADLHIDWTGVSDSSLRTKLKVYRDRNLHLKDVKERLKVPQDEDRPKEEERSKVDDEPTVEDKAKVDEKAKQESEPREEEKAKPDSEHDCEDTLKVEDRIKKEVGDMPLTCAKVFLCGFPEVGKTTLRKTLKRCVQEDWWTKFKWERGPNCIPQSRTKGIEIRRIEEKKAGGNMTLNLWDLAGQQDYHVLHGNFFFFAGQGLAGGKATTFVLVFRETFEEGMQDDLLYWLRFVASGSPVKRHVVIVLNHFGLNSDSLEIGRWLYFIDEYKEQFKDRLNIHPEPFIIDVRVASKVKNLKRYLFDQVRRQLHGVTMPRLCHEMQLALKLLQQGKMMNYLPILTWQAFEKGLKLKSKGEQLSAAAAYLHEMGDIIYFGEQSKELKCEEKILVVPDPEWFCKEVVGELLLPRKWLEGRADQKNKNPERVSLSEFKSLFAHRLDQDQGTRPDAVISMLEFLGLCYKISNEELIVPSLSVGDFDYNSNGWEINKGVEEDRLRVNWVMGRCLQTFEDKNNTAVPMTLFRRLQVGLAKDEDLGGCKSSEYRAGKSFSIFKVDQFMVLVQFDEAANNPNDDRVDVLVKSGVRTDNFARHIDYICKVMQKLQDLCVECCPGVKYDIKVIEPWRAIGEDPRMVKRNVEVSLAEIRDKVKGDRDRCSTWRSDLQWKTFLSDSELEELLGFSPAERQKQQDYEDCKRAAVDMGLADFLNELESLSEPEPELRPENLKTELEIQVWELRQENRALHLKTYKRVEDVISEIGNKHQLLIKKMQAHARLSVQQHSVPRYMYLSREDGVWPWIKFQKAFGRLNFQLHLLCERHVDEGIAHEVDNQEGITVPVSDEKLLLEVERWARWSLQVLVTVGKTVGNIYLPGVFNFIPDGWPNSNVEKDRTKLLLNKDEGGKQVRNDQGNYGAKDEPIEIGRIAQNVMKGLIKSEEPGAFMEKMKLTKVHLQEILDQPSVGPSNQPPRSVLWICFDCHEKYKGKEEYKDRIEDFPA